MTSVWQILRDGGLPLAIEGSGRPPSPSQLALATREAIAEQPGGRDAEALAAFVFAWHQHWPTCFAVELGASAADVLAWARDHALDDDRYIKLRRIAIENLANVI